MTSQAKFSLSADKTTVVLNVIFVRDCIIVHSHEPNAMQSK